MNHQVSTLGGREIHTHELHQRCPSLSYTLVESRIDRVPIQQEKEQNRQMCLNDRCAYMNIALAQAKDRINEVTYGMRPRGFRNLRELFWNASG